MKIKPTNKYILVSKKEENKDEQILLGLSSAYKKDSTEIEVQVLLDVLKDEKDGKKEVLYKKGSKLLVIAGDLKEIKQKNYESVYLIEPTYILAELDSEDGYELGEKEYEN